MNIREQIIHEVMTGKLGTPSIPSETAIQREIVKRTKEQRDSKIPLPIRTDKTSDGGKLISIFEEMEDRLKDIVDTVDAQEQHLLQEDIEQQVSFNKNKKQILSIQDRATDLRVSSPGKSPVKIISEHFRTPNIDMQRSDVDISPQAATASLKRVSRYRVNLRWDPEDVGRFQVVGGKDLVGTTLIMNGSSLNNLVDGTPDNWNATIQLNKAGIIIAEFTVPFSSKRLSMVNRVDLEANTPRPAKLVVYPEKGEEIEIGQTSRIGDVLSWIFEPKVVRALKFVFEWKANSPDDIVLSLDDLGVYLDVYHGTGKIVTNSLHTLKEDEINTVALEVNEELPRNTNIRYYVGLDPIVSGCFLNASSEPVNPGYTSVEFSPATIRSGKLNSVHSSDLRRWSHLSGASAYTSWEPIWTPIQPLYREPTADLPHHVTFDNTATIKYTDKLADGNNYGIEKGYNGTTAGWWRPGVQNDLLGNARQAYPDFTINNKDFYRVFFWPSGSKPIDGSIFLNGGTQTIEDTINVSGAHLWSIAERSQPSLVDVTTQDLVPNSAGIIDISGAGNVEFDTVRDLRFTDSHDHPFARGEEYRVYGSGTTLQVDVSEIEAIGDLFDNPDRTYEVTYTINQEEGVVSSYSFNTTVQVTPDSNSNVQFKRTELLRNIRIIHMNFRGIITNIEVIEDPGGYPQLTRKLKTGYTRIQIVSSTQNYTADEFISFTGDVSSVDTPMGMRQVNIEDLFYNSPRFDHSTFATMPSPSGQTWLVVPDPGSEADREVDGIALGPGNENSPSGNFLFHDSASGVQGYYQLSYSQRLRYEDRIMLRADLSSEDVSTAPKLNSFRIKVNDPNRRDANPQSPGFRKDEDRSTV